MKSIGIICECNPFHRGHQYLIERARASGADTVVALMSGYFVQRGEPAVASPFLRAEALLRCGADLVLELPFPYAAASAEYFADAGVDILERLGVDELWFGSECGDLRMLRNVSELTESEEFLARYTASVSERSGSAEEYFSILRELTREPVPSSPNDILAISYLRSIRKKGARLVPVTVKRIGGGYRSETLEGNVIPSATALRRVWRERGLHAMLEQMSLTCAEVYARAGAPAQLKHAERLILGHFRLTPPERLLDVAELGGGLGNRMAQAAAQAEGLEDFFALSATKKYTDARIRRGVLFALTGILRADLRRRPAYTRLLAANKQGLELLSQRRRKADIQVVTKRADLPEGADAERQSELEARAYGLYTLCLPEGASATGLWREKPTVLA